MHQRQMQGRDKMATQTGPAAAGDNKPRQEKDALNVMRIGDHDLPVPGRETLDSAGYDLRAAAGTVIEPGERLAVRTGFAVQIPEGMVGLVWPRSGSAVRQGLDTLAGVIDADYRGEVAAVLINHGDEPIHISKGDRVAQLVVTSCYQSPVREVESLEATRRGAAGFGSTGVR